MSKQKMASKRPCKTCRMTRCDEKRCAAWQAWFLESWEDVNRYLWNQVDRQGRQTREVFVYELPHLIQSPCDDCICREWCDVPCSLRIKWWDARMGMLRKRGMCGEKR